MVPQWHVPSWVSASGHCAWNRPFSVATNRAGYRVLPLSPPQAPTRLTSHQLSRLAWNSLLVSPGVAWQLPGTFSSPSPSPTPSIPTPFPVSPCKVWYGWFQMVQFQCWLGRGSSEGSRSARPNADLWQIKTLNHEKGTLYFNLWDSFRLFLPSYGERVQATCWRHVSLVYQPLVPVSWLPTVGISTPEQS